MQQSQASGDGKRANGRPLRDALSRLEGFVALLAAPLGNLFFISQPWIGLLLWIVLLIQPRHAAFALLGLLIGEAVERLLRLPHRTRLGGDIRVNGLLAALMTGWLTQDAGLSPQWQLAAAAASATGAAILAAAIMRALSTTRLPSLVWAYCLVSAALFSLFPEWVVSASASMSPWHAPDGPVAWLLTFTRSLGSLLFQPDLTTGLMIGTAVLLWSRIMFVSGVFGWAGGSLVALFSEHLGLSYHWLPAAYNFFLAGMALGCVFFLPGRAGLLVAFVAGSVASFAALLLQLLLPGGSVPYLPISTAVTIWIGMGALTLAGDRKPLRLNNAQGMNPEKAWWQTAIWADRFGLDTPLLAVPVAAPVKVAQGFNGRLSHAGPWRHALDFQFPSQPVSPSQPATIWECPALSPAPGMVERIRNDVPDNPVGVSNYADNWGNHVIIRLDQGGWAMLAHLRQGSVTALPGSRVETGSYLGLAGNSGRSPVPHLHLQVQVSPEPGATTRPFLMANYLAGQQAGGDLTDWHPCDLPGEGEVLMAAPVDPMAYQLLTSTAPGTGVWVMHVSGKVPRAYRQRTAQHIFRITTRLLENGNHSFAADQGGRLLQTHAPDAWRILQVEAGAHPLLGLLGLAMPSIPYAAFAGLNWVDTPPLIPAGITGWLKMTFSPYFGTHLPQLQCHCASVPFDTTLPLRLQTELVPEKSGLPRRIITEFAFLRGPIRLEAEFEHGTVTYNQLSFEPGSIQNGIRDGDD